MAGPPQEYGRVPVAGEGCGFGNSGLNAGLEELAVPFPMARSNQRTGVRSGCDFGDIVPDKPKGLPVTVRRHGVTAQPVGPVGLVGDGRELHLSAGVCRLGGAPLAAGFHARDAATDNPDVHAYYDGPVRESR